MITLKECQNIVASNNTFISKTEEVLGYNTHLFNYFLASYKDFKETGAYELRGLTFIEETPVLHLHKFFNLNENESTLYNDLKDLEIDEVMLKEDGSMLIPVVFPNGQVKWKTKMSWNNEQTEMAEALFSKSESLRDFVQLCHKDGYQPIFELVSPYNKIVVDYSETKLVLLQIRDFHGNYMTHNDKVSFAKFYDIPVVQSVPKYSLEKFIEMSETVEGIEGWVIKFTNGTMIKLKTKWYKELHGLLTDGLGREDFIFEKVLNEEIDDVLAQVPENDTRKLWVQDVAQAIGHHCNELVQEASDILKTYNGDRKDFAITNKNHRLFGVLMRSLEKDMETVEKSVVEYLKTQTKGLNKAKDYLYGVMNSTIVKI